MPLLAARSTPSRNGKKASEASAAPLSDSPASAALRVAMRQESMRLIWPAPTASVAPALANTSAFDFTKCAIAQANSMSAYSATLGARAETTRRSARLICATSRSCTSSPPPTLFTSRPPTSPAGSGPLTSTRTFCFAAVSASASALASGAMITSTNWLARICAAVGASSGRLKAITPPKAEVGSVR